MEPYKDIYEKFLEFFSIIPCLMLFPYKNILQAEFLASHRNETVTINNQIANAFTQSSDNPSYNIVDFLIKLWGEKEFVSSLKHEVHELKNIAKCWNSQRVETRQVLSNLGLREDFIDEKYYRKVEKETIIKDLVANGLLANVRVDINKFPGARIMKYSQFSRVHMSKRAIKANDVMDVKISCVIPYVEAVITENCQAEIYKKAKRFINELEKLEIYRLKDIRN